MGLWTKCPVVLVSFFKQPVRSLCSLHKRLEVSRAHNQALGSREPRKGSRQQLQLQSVLWKKPFTLLCSQGLIISQTCLYFPLTLVQ